MIKQGLPQARGYAHTGFGRKPLSREGKGKPDQGQNNQNQEVPGNQALLISCNAFINNAGNHQRDQKVHQGFGKLQQGSQHTFLPVFLKKPKQHLHANTSSVT